MRTTSLCAVLGAAVLGCAAEIAEPTRAELGGSCSGFNRDYVIPGPVGWGFEPREYAAQATDSIPSGLVTVHERHLLPDSSVPSHAMFVRVDSNGDNPDVRRYGTDGLTEEFQSVVRSHDSEHAVVTGSALDDLWVVKIRLSDFNVVWSYRIGTAGSIEAGTAIRRISDSVGDDYLVLGSIDEFNGEQTLPRLYMVRIADDGTLRWNRHYAEAIDTRFSGATMDARIVGGRVIIAGIRQDLEGAFGRSVALVRIRASDGSFLSMSHYPHDLLALGAWTTPTVTHTDAGGWAVAYTLREFMVSYAVYLELDSSFNPLFERFYEWDAPGTTETYGRGIFRRADGGYDISTQTEDHSAILRIDSAGNLVSHRHFGDTAPVDEIGTSPMARVGSSYVLKALHGDVLRLTSIPVTGSGCCEEHIPTLVTPAMPFRVNVEMPDIAWGVRQEHAVSEIEVPVTYTSCEGLD